MNQETIYQNWLNAKSQVFLDHEQLNILTWEYLQQQYFLNPDIANLMYTASLHANEKPYIRKQIFQDLSTKFNFNYLGNGHESLVLFDYPTQLVVALSLHPRSVHLAETSFYTQRILYNLFPQNFCNFLASISGPRHQPSGTIRSLVRPSGNELSFEYGTAEMNRIMDLPGLVGLPVIMDYNPDHFIQRGNTYVYVDEVDLSYDVWNIRRLENFMANHDYTLETKMRIRESYQLIQQLNRHIR